MGSLESSKLVTNSRVELSKGIQSDSTWHDRKMDHGQNSLTNEGVKLGKRDGKLKDWIFTIKEKLGKKDDTRTKQNINSKVGERDGTKDDLVISLLKKIKQGKGIEGDSTQTDDLVSLIKKIMEGKGIEGDSTKNDDLVSLIKKINEVKGIKKDSSKVDEMFSLIKMITQGTDSTQNDWAVSIIDEIRQRNIGEDTSEWSKLSIYKIPHYLHKNDKKSYSPQTVSIGPYHHGEAQLEAMESHKRRALNQVLKRTRKEIKIYNDAMMGLEKTARECYEAPLDLWGRVAFTEMLLFDGCFVLEMLRGAVDGFSKLGYHREDPVFAIRGFMHSIKLDMMMLENQIPLFVLNQLLELELGSEYHAGLVEKLAVKFFDSLMPTAEINSGKSNSQVRNNANDLVIQTVNLEKLHCLDVIRLSLRFPTMKQEYPENEWDWGTRVADKRKQYIIPCVTELRDAGFKFRKRETQQFWDIKFQNGYLEIPSLFIHDGTKSLFLNLIAFEQCRNQCNSDITTYLIFMDNLINTREDIIYLRQCGIIKHSLGSDSEVADMFNQLCLDVVFNIHGIYLSGLLNEVNEYHNKKYFRKWNAWKNTLKHKYFDNPWAYISFLAAVILLVLTLLQSFFAVYAYFKPPS